MSPWSSPDRRPALAPYRLGLATAAALLSACAAPGAMQPHRDPLPVSNTYLLTQAAAGTTLVARVGAALQIQLPANPSVWKLIAIRGDAVEPRGHTLMSSPGRIPRFESVDMIDFTVIRAGRAEISLGRFEAGQGDPVARFEVTVDAVEAPKAPR